jgi:predicted transcriptional regulator
MSSVKETITRIVDDQPDDASYEEILRELALRRMIDRGLADSDAGRTIPDQELRRRMGTWPR